MIPVLHRALRAAGRVRSVSEAAGAAVAARVRPRAGRERVELGDGALSGVASRELVDAPRIVLDGVFFQLPYSGIARVWTALMREWSASGFAQHVVVLDREGSAPRFPGFTYRRTTPFRRFDSLAQRVALESICRAERADLFISTYYTLPLTTRSLLYLYDMIPEVLGFDLREPVWREKGAAIRHADSYVAISESTAGDLHRFYSESRTRPVLVAPNAADAVFSPASEELVAGLLRDLDLPRDYCVFVGPRDVEYKNVQLVLGALALIPEERRPALLLVGGAPELEAWFVSKAAGSVVRLARLADEQLRVAYSGARGLLYPSKYEGFGIPILEAMACGCPVVTCRNSSIPEVADDAAIYVAEDDASELASAIEQLDDPAVRERLRAQGLERAREFRWANTAADVECFVREVLTT